MCLFLVPSANLLCTETQTESSSFDMLMALLMLVGRAGSHQVQILLYFVLVLLFVTTFHCHSVYGRKYSLFIFFRFLEKGSSYFWDSKDTSFVQTGSPNSFAALAGSGSVCTLLCSSM